MDDVVRQRKAVLPADLETVLGRLERGLEGLYGGRPGPGALRLLRAGRRTTRAT